MVLHKITKFKVNDPHEISEQHLFKVLFSTVTIYMNEILYKKNSFPIRRSSPLRSFFYFKNNLIKFYHTCSYNWLNSNFYTTTPTNMQVCGLETAKKFRMMEFKKGDRQKENRGKKNSRH